MALDRKESTRRSIRHLRRSAPSSSRADEGQTRPLKSKCKTYCRKFLAFLVSNVGLCVLVIAYSVCGAFVFRELEYGNEVNTAISVLRARNNTVYNLWNVTYHKNVLYYDNWVVAVETEIKQFQTDIMSAIKHGYEGKADEKPQDQWSFPGAFLFSLTVISTIGNDICLFVCRIHSF